MLFKNLIIAGVLFSNSLFGICDKEETVTENFVIYDIEEDGYVRGEIIPGPNNQTGEGIYYTINQLKNAGLKSVKVGDKISITWLKEDYEDEYWVRFIAKEMD